MFKSINGKNRIFYLDQIRALAIILVILCHVVREYCQIRPVGSLGFSAAAILIDFGVIGVPLFLMISESLLLNRDYDLPDFLKRRFTRILIPFIFWALLLPIYKIIIYPSAPTLSNYLSLFIDGQYWFVWMLIGVYLFLPVVNAFIQKYQIKGAEYFLVIWLITIILNTFGLYPFHNLELSYFAGYVGYLVLGYYLTNKEFKLSDKQMIWIGLILFIVFTAINIHFTLTHGKIGRISDSSLKYYHYETLIVVLQATGVFLIFENFAKYCSKHTNTFRNKIYSFFKDTFISKIIYSISVCSYGMFLTHYFFVYGFRWIDKNIFPIYSETVKYLPIALILIIFLSWLLIYVLSKIPYLKEISGAH
ncbi:MAG: acyltransferase [Methanobacteriaceae archaeon]|nr:acyltransferase [Methanobacteriaceae archaeon]